MDPEDQQLTSDVMLGHGCLEEKKLAGGDDDGAKAADLVNGAETNPNPAQNLRVCDFCGKTFTSGKALGGHRRSHFQVLKAERSIKKKAKNHGGNRRLSSVVKTCASADMNDDGNITGHMSGDQKKHTCCLCDKDFPSMKSLFGHMRCHPGRPWKGVLPPPTFAPTAADALAPQSEEKSSPLNSTSALLGEYNDVPGDGYVMMNPDASSNTPAPIPVDPFKAIRWEVTAKRGRRTVGAVAAAECLIQLSQGKYLPSKINNQCTKNEARKISKFSSDKKNGGIAHLHRLADHNEKHNNVRKIKVICRMSGSVKIRDKAVDHHEVCKEGGNLLNSSQLNMITAHEDDDHDHNDEIEEANNSEGGNHVMNKQLDEISEVSKKKMKKMEKRDILSSGNSCNTDSNKFGRCSKTSQTSQALGGHRSSCQEQDNNSISSMDEETTPDASTVQKAQINEAKEMSQSIDDQISNTVTEEANHNSNINCNIQTLTGSLDGASLGEASDQSCHEQGASSGEATDQSNGKQLDIDLNLPYVHES